MNEELIKALTELANKFGIVIDWTSQNALPYAQKLMNRIIKFEIVTSEYEDVSKSDVIKDIAEWNKNVYNYKHWANNPWTSWFYSKRIADSIEMIETEGREE